MKAKNTALFMLIAMVLLAGCSVKKAESVAAPEEVVLSDSEPSTPSIPTPADEAEPSGGDEALPADWPPSEAAAVPDITIEDLLALSTPTMSRQPAGLTAIAGTGGRGFRNGGFQEARFTLPNSLFVNPNGTVIVFDTYNNSLRTITADGTQTLVGFVEYYDEYGFPKGYYLDAALNKALLNRPADGVMNSKNNLFIADSGNHVIRVIRGDSVYTYSGSSAGYADGNHNTAKFNTPMAIAIDGNDNIYVADTLNNSVRKIDTSGNVTTVAGMSGIAGAIDGAANEARFRDPAGIAVSADGNVIYVADTGNHLIRKIENGIVTTIAGDINAAATETPMGGFNNGAASSALFNLPRGLALADGVLYIADSANHMVRAITAAGKVVTIAGDGEPGLLNSPSGVSVGNKILYIADTNSNQIKSMKLED